MKPSATSMVVADLVVALCVLVSQCSADPPSPIPPGTGYERFFQDLRHRSGSTDLPKRLTEKDGTTWHALWPTVRWNKNAASCYARARRYFSDEDPPPGSTSALEDYLGDSEAIRRWVQANEKPLRYLRWGLAMDYYRPPPESSQSSIPSILLSANRQLARLAADAGFVRECQRRPDDAVAWNLRCIMLSRQLRSNSLQIGGLVACAVQNTGTDNLAALLANAKLSPRSLRRIIATCQASGVTSTDLQQTTRLEKAQMLWWLEGFEREPEKLLKGVEAWEAVTPVGEQEDDPYLRGLRKLAHASLPEYRRMMKDYAAFHDALVQEFGRPFDEIVRTRRAFDDLVPAHLRAMTFTSEPVYVLWLEKMAWHETALRALATRAAIMLYAAERGGIPRTLSELVPVYLKAVPIDPFSGKPLLYRATQHRWRLYSVGPNGVDDGGTFHYGSSLRPSRKSPDLVFLDRLRDNKERRSGLWQLQRLPRQARPRALAKRFTRELHVLRTLPIPHDGTDPGTFTLYQQNFDNRAIVLAQVTIRPHDIEARRSGKPNPHAPKSWQRTHDTTIPLKNSLPEQAYLRRLIDMDPRLARPTGRYASYYNDDGPIVHVITYESKHLQSDGSIRICRLGIDARAVDAVIEHTDTPKW